MRAHGSARLCSAPRARMQQHRRRMHLVARTRGIRMQQDMQAGGGGQERMPMSLRGTHGSSASGRCPGVDGLLPAVRRCVAPCLLLALLSSTLLHAHAHSSAIVACTYTCARAALTCCRACRQCAGCRLQQVAGCKLMQRCAAQVVNKAAAGPTGIFRKPPSQHRSNQNNAGCTSKQGRSSSSISNFRPHPVIGRHCSSTTSIPGPQLPNRSY